MMWKIIYIIYISKMLTQIANMIWHCYIIFLSLYRYLCFILYYNKTALWHKWDPILYKFDNFSNSTDFKGCSKEQSYIEIPSKLWSERSSNKVC